MPTISTGTPTANATIPNMQITLNDHITVASQKTAAGGSLLISSAQIDDVFSTANSVDSGYASHLIDGSITANGTAVTFGNSTTSLGDTITPVTLRYLRVSNDPTNVSIAFTSNITGFPSGYVTPGGHIKWFANATNGLSIPANGSITATGANTTQTLRITMLVN
jgi:hypothetical protein